MSDSTNSLGPSGREAWKCAEALLKQTMADKMEILIVDNHSDDDSIGFIRNKIHRDPRIRVLETRKNAGFGAGYNLGFRHARGKYLLLNNPAKLLKSDAVQKMVDAMEKDPSIGILGPKLTHPDGSIRDSYRSFPGISDVLIKRSPLFHLFKGRMRRYLQWDRDPDMTGETDWVVGGCLMMPRDLCLNIGGFDERFFLFFEDTDLCRRIWQAGKRVMYFPEATGTDRKSRLSEGGLLALFTKKTARIHVWSGFKYFWKWHRSRT